MREQPHYMANAREQKKQRGAVKDVMLLLALVIIPFMLLLIAFRDEIAHWWLESFNELRGIRGE